MQRQSRRYNRRCAVLRAMNTNRLSIKKERNRGAEAKCSKCSKRHSKRDKGGARESTGGARERTGGSARTVPYCSFEEIAWIAANGPQIKMPTLKSLWALVLGGK
jgi:hypothetical protein